MQFAFYLIIKIVLKKDIIIAHQTPVTFWYNLQETLAHDNSKRINP